MFQNLFYISLFCFEVVAAVAGMAQTVAGLEYLNLPWLTSAVMLVRISLVGVKFSYLEMAPSVLGLKQHCCGHHT